MRGRRTEEEEEEEEWKSEDEVDVIDEETAR